ERLISFQDEIVTALSKDDRRTFREIFLNIHPTDQAAVYLALESHQHARIRYFLSAKEFADVFQALDPEQQTKAVEEMDDHYTVENYFLINVHTVVDFHDPRSAEYRKRLISLMDEEDTEKVKELLDYIEDSEGTIMTKEYIAVKEEYTADMVMEQLSKEAAGAETIYYLYITDSGHHLKGVISLREIVMAG